MIHTFKPIHNFPDQSADNTRKHDQLKWILAGLALVGCLFVISNISHRFKYQLSDLDKPIISLVVLMIIAGLIYLGVIHHLRGSSFSRRLLIWVVLVGLLGRLSMFLSIPILEDDHYRYLWDGGVLASGFNPYRYSPLEVVAGEAHHMPAELHHLAITADPIPERINYPWLRTIYPPLTIAAFAFAHLIDPWSLTAWRFVLLSLDFIVLYIIYRVLRNLNLPDIGLVIYWWNPLLIKEIYNSGHMDLLAFPLTLGALIFSIQRRYLMSAGAIGLAAGVKLWPAILLPVALRPLLKEPIRIITAVLLSGSISIAVLLPFFLTGLGAHSGFLAYAQYWEMNDSLFMLIRWTAEFITAGFGRPAVFAQIAARAAVVAILVGFIFLTIRKDNRLPDEIARRFLLVIAALYLLSPTQFPWYYLWLLPVLAIHPRSSLLLLTVLLPLYYLRFYFDARGMAEVHDNFIVWLEFAPVWSLLIWEWRKGLRLMETNKKEL